MTTTQVGDRSVTTEAAAPAHRRLGQQGPAVLPIGLGCMGMSQFYGPTDDEESVRVVRRALELGVGLFDTADMYGPYHNEQLLGRALGADRPRAVVMTKVGNVKDGGGRVVGVNGSPAYVVESCEGSLRRLGLEVIDVYCLHRVDPDVPVEETWGAMAGLVEAGKVRHLALSEAALDTVRRAHDEHPVALVQTELSVASRDPLEALVPELARRGVGFVAYAPLGRGLLSGRLGGSGDLSSDDFRSGLPRFQEEQLRHNLAVSRRLSDLAADLGLTLPQLGLAWVLAQGEHVLAIPGTKTVARLEENVSAASVVLPTDVLGEIERLAPAGWAAGDRYPDMSGVDR